MKAIIHAKAVTPNGILSDATLLLEDGLIRAIGTDLAVPADAEVLDAGGMWVGPGFVDIHLHGDGINSRWEWDPVPVLHITYGPILCGELRERFFKAMHKFEAEYEAALEKHFDKHLTLLGVPAK